MARILIVDDEPLLLRALTRAFGTRHDVVAAKDAADALGALEVGGFDLVLVDRTLSGVSGKQLVAIALARRPAMAGRFVLMSGAFDDRESWPGQRLSKPFGREDLDRVLACASGLP